MYDPSIFDNLKVVTEGALYDLDRQGDIRISSRQDLIDLAAMSRTFRLQFGLPHDSVNLCEIELFSGLSDFAAELGKLRLVESVAPGCRLLLRYRISGIQPGEPDMRAIEQALNSWWPEGLRTTHTLSTSYFFEKEQSASRPIYTVEALLTNKIGEEQIQDLQAFVKHSADSFSELLELLHV